MKLQTSHFRRAVRAFTMIEMLVVFGVIAIIAGLIVAGAGHAQTVARLHRAESDLQNLSTAIELYKNKTGSYPPDNNPSSPAQSQLFYELTGTVISLDGTGAPLKYYSPVTGETFNLGDFATVFGPSVTGFANATADPAQVQNFMPSVSKSSFTGKQMTGAVANTFFGVQVDGPLRIRTMDGKIMSPWSYVSKGVHNPDSYDLWVDVTAGHGTYRISNWSKEPQPQ